MNLPLTKLLIALASASLIQGMLLAFEPEIKLAGRKDLVLSIESRETVLRVGLTHLTKSKDDYSSLVEELENPFAFESDEPIKPVVEEKVDDTPPEPTKIDYDDQTVLKAASTSFSKQVRGSIARGDTIFLQLEGGTLLKPGKSFQVRLPKADPYTVTVSEITLKGYTLQVGEASKSFNYDDTSQSGSGSIQLTNPQ